jgi:mRNA-degrading endonuclease RelE of RelBE toxin-antitoxin system
VQIELTKRFFAAVKKLPAAEVAAVDEALAELLANFGRPHAHSGASVRPLLPPVYEMRASLALRIVFARDGDILRVDFVGDHAGVRRYLRNP